MGLDEEESLKISLGAILLNLWKVNWPLTGILCTEKGAPILVKCHPEF